MIRTVTTDDAEALGTIHVRSWQAAYRGLMPNDYLDSLDGFIERRVETHRRLASIDGTRHTYLLSEDDGVPVAFLYAAPSRDEDSDDDTAEILMIYALHSHWGQGHGGALMSQGLIDLARIGYQSVMLWVLDGNDRAIRFYEACGFVADGVAKTDEIDGQIVQERRFVRLLKTG